MVYLTTSSELIIMDLEGKSPRQLHKFESQPIHPPIVAVLGDSKFWSEGDGDSDVVVHGMALPEENQGIEPGVGFPKPIRVENVPRWM